MKDDKYSHYLVHYLVTFRSIPKLPKICICVKSNLMSYLITPAEDIIEISPQGVPRQEITQGNVI